MIKRGNNKAALQLSISTIVVVVLAMAMLVLGMVLVRTIMCSGIQLTQEIDQSTRNEIKDLFQNNEYGVKCMGQGNKEVTIADGGRRNVGCVITAKDNKRYDIDADVEALGDGVSTRKVNEWIIDEGWEGDVMPGTKTVPVVVFDIPQNTPDTTLKVTYTIKSDTGTETIKTYVDVTHAGGLTTTIC